MKISVVIPLYNKSKYIRRAIDSVLAQSIQVFEIIVVDDGSTDDSSSIVKEYKDSRICLIQQANAGASVARNRGVAEAKADFVAFLDADDEWNIDFLLKISELIERYPQAGMFATSYSIVDADGVHFPVISNSRGLPLGWSGILLNYPRHVYNHPPFNSSSNVLRKDVLMKVNGFPVGVKHGEDLDTWLRMYFAAPIAFYYTHMSTYYRSIPNSAMSSWIPDENFVLFRTINSYLESNQCDAECTQDLQDYLTSFKIKIAGLLVYQGQTHQARTILRNTEHTRRFAYQRLWWLFWSFIPPSLNRKMFVLKAYLRKIISQRNHED